MPDDAWECNEVYLKDICVTQKDTSTDTLTLIVSILCVTLFIVAFVVIIFCNRMSKKKKDSDGKTNVELNDMYGTYYQGAEYNTATDENPKYNEDGCNGIAFVTDKNIYYDNLIDNSEHVKNGPSSKNGNVYQHVYHDCDC